MDVERREDEEVPLCVDLDRTLVTVDTLHEALVRSVLRHPRATVRLLKVLLFRGRAALKATLVEATLKSASGYPFQKDLVEFLKEESARRPVWLVTASDLRTAQAVADRLGFFTGVIGSDGTRNLKGAEKGAMLRERFGEGKFDYIGDAYCDLEVWRSARRCGAVSPSGRTERALATLAPLSWRFERPRANLKIWARALRVHQWVKNLLVFMPLVMAHQLQNAQLLLQTVGGFFAFSLCASAVYLLNDLSDIDADRAHGSKKSRPIAAGLVSTVDAIGAAIALLGLSALTAALLPWQFALCLLLYFVTTTFYTAVGKEIPVLDILFLASLYTLRLFAGGMAADVPVSHWALAFSMFLFLSLACAKRGAELHSLREQGGVRAERRGYIVEDLEQVGRFGSTSGYLSVLVMALYLRSPEVLRLYREPELLWFACPVLLYWISRIWLLVGRGELNEDPILFAIHDKASYVCGVLCGVILILAS